MIWITFNVGHLAYQHEPNDGVPLYTCVSLYLEYGRISRCSVH